MSTLQSTALPGPTVDHVTSSTGSSARPASPYDHNDCRLALNRNVPIPIWAQIADFLAAAIIDGRLATGQWIGSEHDLAQRFHVTRTTIRRALADLDQRGLISRTRATSTRVKQAHHRP